MSVDILTLNPKQTQKALKLLDEQLFRTSCDLIYEGQTPNAAYLLLKGDIKIYKENKVISNLSNGQLIGLNELLAQERIGYTARVESESIMLIIYKHMINQIKKLLNL